MSKKAKNPSELSVATWNINSVRLRAGLVQKYLKQAAPDVLCLQEIKCRDDQFPANDFMRLGYEHQAVYGFKGYHGVAILSKLPFRAIERFDIAGQAEGRCIIAHLHGKKFDDIAIASVYLPAGGDIPDPESEFESSRTSSSFWTILRSGVTNSPSVFRDPSSSAISM